MGGRDKGNEKEEETERREEERDAGIELPAYIPTSSPVMAMNYSLYPKYY